MAQETVRVVFRKYDGSLHWNFDQRLLGEDEHGVWLGGPEGILLRRGHEPPRAFHAFVGLYPREGWWAAAFNSAPDRTEVYVDIATPSRWRTDESGVREVTAVDLDLDVRRLRTGEVQLLDEDEFAEHRVKYGYPDEVVTRAETTAAWLYRALGDGTEPFATAYRHWLRQVSDGAA